MTKQTGDDEGVLASPAGALRPLELEAAVPRGYPDPADADHGEVLMATGAGFAVVSVGVAVASSLCPPCMLALVPICAVVAPGVFGAGLLKRWRRARVRAPTSCVSETHCKR